MLKTKKGSKTGLDKVPHLWDVERRKGEQTEKEEKHGETGTKPRGLKGSRNHPDSSTKNG